MDESGHGTNTASVVAASSYTVGGVTYRGVAPDAKLVALRVGTESNISDFNIERALQWVIDNYQTYHIDVVNLSLGAGFYPDPQTDIESNEFQQLHDLGIFVVAASGNSNDAVVGPITQDGIAYPAADPNVFAVGAVDSADVITSWSQRGDELDMLAPGADIVMPKLGGGFVTEDGTSFASPYVAGAAALIKQKDPTAKAGDIGSILMASGKDNRDGQGETGNTTTLQYSRLDIEAALKLVSKRVGKHATLDFGGSYDTALDSDGVLHAAWYDRTTGHLDYATRDISGMWSDPIVIDDQGDVGAMPSIAIDSTGKVGVAYFDITNTSVKYAQFSGSGFSNVTIESDKHVGTYPSLAFDVDGNAYVAYYKRSGSNLRMATLNRDAGTWGRRTIAADVTSSLSLDVGEAALRDSGGFTVYDTTVAIAYGDGATGNLKYARLDLDDPTATWFLATVDTAAGVSNINLNLHTGPQQVGLQAQIVYQDTTSANVKYAYRNTNWFVENVATSGKVGDYTQFYFDSSENPIAVFFDRDKKALYSSARGSNGVWSERKKFSTSAGPMSIGMNERTGHADISWLNRPRTDVFSAAII
jgi:subtilisin family serine protease